jgi:predicted small lipoprotein YifL
MARTICGVRRVRHSRAMKTKTILLPAALAALAALAACGGGAKQGKPAEEPVAAKTMPVAAATPPADEPTGFAECDAYVAELRYFHRCEELPREARDAQDLEQTLAAARQGWRSVQEEGTPTEARQAVIDACNQSNLALHEIIAAVGGCHGIGAEPALPARSEAATARLTTTATGVPECDRYLATARRLVACDSVPAQQRQMQQQALDAAEPGWKSLADPQVPAEARTAAADACRQAADAIERTLTQARCPGPTP